MHDSVTETMDFRLLLSIIVLDLAMIALHTSQISCQVSLIRDYDPDCIIEGTVITLNCTVEDRNDGFGATIIDGSHVIFNCSSVNTIADNKLYLQHSQMQSSEASCGDFVSGRIVEVVNGTYIAQIIITTTIDMNGEYVECSELGIPDSQQIQLANISEGVIMADTSLTLTKNQCIEVSINQLCNESADSFQAQLQFADGACGESRLNKTIGNYTMLQHDYKTCIPVGTDPICFSAVMFHNGVEVARTGSEELILLQCSTSNISSVYNNGVTVTNSTTMEVVLQGTEVLHNTVLSFQCDLLCKLMGTNTTRCVNGTFESLLNESAHCDCGQRTNVIVGVTIPILFAMIMIMIICFINKNAIR